MKSGRNTKKTKVGDAHKKQNWEKHKKNKLGRQIIKRKENERSGTIKQCMWRKKFFKRLTLIFMRLTREEN